MIPSKDSEVTDDGETLCITFFSGGKGVLAVKEKFDQSLLPNDL